MLCEYEEAEHEAHEATIASVQAIADHATARAEKAEEELTRLRALLASGQCVDLARVSDEEVLIEHLGGLKWPDVSDVRALRAWLIEKAGVKA